MAKKSVVKKKKKAPTVLPTLPIHPPVLLTGVCKCDTENTLSVRLPHHARVEHQMLTARCRTCGDTFYLTERGVV